MFPKKFQCTIHNLPSVLWHCWLGGRKGIRSVKNWVVRCRRGYLLERGADLHMFQLMPLPLTVSCSSKIQIGFTFLVPAHLGSPRQRAIKRVCVCSCALYTTFVFFKTQQFHKTLPQTAFFLWNYLHRVWIKLGHGRPHEGCEPKGHMTRNPVTGQIAFPVSDL